MEEIEHFTFPIIGSIAPSFEAETTQGNISFPNDYKGKWIILFPTHQILPQYAQPNLWHLLQ